ncbi:similar to Saccharomyces cerevisiae YHL020C OPI1 Transcriptional regulator of a variety of genes [Maudiozyma barnettii]|uniref:Similar to Saccharomyces cerevisiae YHL020C OPI1 Transcriptional regulator of a variety of genes n=1 Tax=Maudiozyma barnettii TaxID=61262 RepID=A0A8H2ZJD1_9SACH|nr:transcriptional regulator OPI1 [Kazachstania barnettii]CAB4256898.1 similar to Saccharomyces cerevisiae YHL020C OPI1 Transcriptional regulator of a variety of genes [Kazachstania barnettii]CAD1785503.1 similar to Saccharomyces cerevisiae YHL020C OPI1 Transcriptional regulator of a variety of genes [Kazachstania barnettii]
MGLREHLGMSEEDLKAAEVLGVLKKSQPKYTNALNGSSKRRRSISDDTNESTMESNRAVKPRNNTTGHSGTLLNRMVNNVVTFYDDFNDRRRVASIARLLDDAYEDNYTSSENDSDSGSDDENEEEIDATKEAQQGLNELPQKKPEEEVNHVEHPMTDESGAVILPQDENEEESEEERVSKRKIISEALQTTRDNLKEYKLNMSIESKKRLITCLHLLKLANKQLSDKVMNLQAMVKEEKTVPRRRRRTLTNSHDRHGVSRHRRQRASTISGESTMSVKTSNNEKLKTTQDGVSPMGEKQPTHPINAEKSETSESGSGSETDAEEDYYGGDEDEEFFDAFDSNDFDEKSTVIKMEVVGTIKKVYSLISSYTGDSLPEPARSQVRESLLNLPTNWFLTASNTSGNSMENVSSAGSSDNPNTSIGTPKCQDKGMTIEDINKKISRARSSSAASGGADSNLTPNGKVLILAKESLDMVQNVMDVVDSTLGKAEEWVKQKQEVKEMFLKSLLEKQRMKESIDIPLTRPQEESTKEN